MSQQHENATPEVILILGKTGVGKSTFIEAATGLKFLTGDSLNSCTQEVQIYPVPNTKSFLIDTPGFDDPVRSDTSVLQQISTCLSDLHSGLLFPSSNVNLSGIIYIHPINEPRMTGSMMKNLRMLPLLIGDVNMSHCVLVTSKWGLSEDPQIAGEREAELISTSEYWGRLLAAGASISRYEDCQKSALEIMAAATRQGEFIPQLIKEYVIEGKELSRTAAGRAIDIDMAEARERNRQELETLRIEYEQALENEDAKAAEELKTITSRIETSLKAIDAETEQLRETRAEAQRRMDELEESASLASERDDTEFDTASSIKSDDTYMDDGPKKSSSSSIRTDDYPTVPAVLTSAERSRARQKRGLRWFSRFTAMGGAIAMSVLTGGAMAPVGFGLVGVVEAACQADKDREVQKRLGSRG